MVVSRVMSVRETGSCMLCGGGGRKAKVTWVSGSAPPSPAHMGHSALRNSHVAHLLILITYLSWLLPGESTNLPFSSLVRSMKRY